MMRTYDTSVYPNVVQPLRHCNTVAIHMCCVVAIHMCCGLPPPNERGVERSLQAFTGWCGGVAIGRPKRLD